VSWYFVGGVILPSGSLILKSALTMLPAAVLALLGSRIWKASNFLGVFLTLRITSLVLSFASVFKFLVSRGLVGALALSLGGSLGLALSLGWPITCTAMTPAISKPAANRRTTGPGRKNPVTSLHLVVRGHIILKGESRKQAVHARFSLGLARARRFVFLWSHLATAGTVEQGVFRRQALFFSRVAGEFANRAIPAIRRAVGRRRQQSHRSTNLKRSTDRHRTRIFRISPRSNGTRPGTEVPGRVPFNGCFCNFTENDPPRE